MDIEPRPLVAYREYTYCPEAQEVGCQSCDDLEDCHKEAHEENNGDIPGCEICEQMDEDAQDYEDQKGDMQHQMMKDEQAEAEIE